MAYNKTILRILILLCLLNITSLMQANDRKRPEENDSTSYYRPLATYKVLRIKDKKKYYVIYAVSNDTIYKILSKKQEVNCPKCVKIRRWKKYEFTLESLFPRYIGGERLMPPGTTGRMGLYFCGEAVYLETNRNIWDLYIANNLKDLYIVEDEEGNAIEILEKPKE